MKHFFSITLFLASFACNLAFANDVSNGISISANNIPEELIIDITNDVAGKVTLSVFSQNGEIVIERELSPGANRISVNRLPAGSYTAVVRENDVFREKQTFEVM
jgi:hypothetical protein